MSTRCRGQVHRDSDLAGLNISECKEKEEQTKNLLVNLLLERVKLHLKARESGFLESKFMYFC